MKVMGCIGAGAFGTVLEVDIHGKPYALKKIKAALDEDQQENQMGSREGKIHQECPYHPNIIRCYASFRRKDSYYLVMELASGRPLSEQAMPLSTASTLTLVIHLTLALCHLRENQIVHRDIKPANILLSSEGLFKISDFGISRVLRAEEKAESQVGTPFYTAPQVHHSVNYDYSADVWSMGVVLYEALHGRLPFMAPTVSQLRTVTLKHEPKIDHNLHIDLKRLLKGCLQKNPSHRIKPHQILELGLVRAQMRRELGTRVGMRW